MGVPANHSAGAAAPGTTFGRFRSGYVPRRRRPSGAAPPLPHHVRATGLGWLSVTSALVTAPDLRRRAAWARGGGDGR